MEILNSIQKLYHVSKLQSRKMVSFSSEKRSEMIGAIKFGATFDQVSAKYGCQKRTVKNIWQRYLSTGSVRDRHRPGRPKIFSVGAKDELLENKENPFLTAVESGIQWAVSRFTVGRILKKFGLECRKPHKVPVISQQNKTMRRILQTKLEAGINNGQKSYGQMGVGFACTSMMVRSKSIVNPKPDMQKEINCNVIAGKLEE